MQMKGRAETKMNDKEKKMEKVSSPHLDPILTLGRNMATVPSVALRQPPPNEALLQKAWPQSVAGQSSVG